MHAFVMYLHKIIIFLRRATSELGVWNPRLASQITFLVSAYLAHKSIAPDIFLFAKNHALLKIMCMHLVVFTVKNIFYGSH